MRRRASFLLISLWTLTACAGSDGTGPPDAPTPASIAISAGDGQAAKATQNFGQPLVVKVAAASGKPIAGVRVSFQVTAGLATLNPAEATSDAEGLARTSVAAGSTPGAVSVSARTVGVASAATFSLNITPLAVAISVVSGNLQSIAPAQAFTQPLVVKVSDDAGNGVNGIRVTFEISGTAATLNPVEGTTDAQGLARTTVMAGAVGGVVAVTARAAFVTTPATFTLNIQVPIEGTWRGMTSQNNPILLRVNSQRTLDSLSVRVSFAAGAGTCTVTLNARTTNLISGSAFDFTYRLDAFLNLQLTGTFSESNSAAGTIRIVSPSGAFTCGNLLIFGSVSNVTLTTRTFTATKS